QDEGKAVPPVASDIESAQLPKQKAARTWLKDPHLYKVAIIYACTKGSEDVFYAYLPLLLTDKLKFEKEAIANLPLILLASATLSTQISRKLSGKIGEKWSFIVAALTVTGSCLWFLCINQSSRVFTYPAVVLLGFGSSAMFVNALGFATELIGDNKLNQHSQDVSQDEGRAMPSVVSDTESAQPPKRKAVRTWLKDPHLYKVAIIYACTKGSQDVFYAYLPLLLTDKLKFEKEAIANLPLILLVSATLSSQISRKLSGKVGKKWSFIVAALTVTGSCLWFLRINQSSRVFTYPAVVLLGFGSSAMFVNALGFATELIGDNKGSSGFVISVVGTTSNLTSGTLYIVIQVLFPRGSASADCQECGSYVQNVFSFVPSSLATFSLLLVMIFQVHLTVCGKEG
ncbi:hypothetical protein pdam_00019494, partial [Pocillopora damicornis]